MHFHAILLSKTIVAISINLTSCEKKDKIKSQYLHPDLRQFQNRHKSLVGLTGVQVFWTGLEIHVQAGDAQACVLPQ